MRSRAHRKAKKGSSVTNEHVGGTMASADHGAKNERVDAAYRELSKLVESMRSAPPTAQQMEFQVQSVIEGDGLVPTIACCARVAARCGDLIRKQIARKYFKKCVVEELRTLAAADVSPLNGIFSQATKFADKYPVFSTTDHAGIFKRRYCECSSLIETPLVKNVRELLTREGATPLPLIGGPSGGGKTTAVISLSSKASKTIVAYIIGSIDFKKYLAAPPTPTAGRKQKAEKS